MKRYRLTVHFEFTQSDDPGARGVALAAIYAIRKALTAAIFDPIFKLQELYDDKPPRKVKLP